MEDKKYHLPQMWKLIYEVFDPAQPVTNPALRAQRLNRYNPLVKVEFRLDRPFGNARFAIAGGVGSGNTTELLASAERLSRSRLVVYFDVFHHMENTLGDPAAINHLQTWELVGLLGLAILRAGEDHFHHTWSKDAPLALASALQDLRQATLPSDARHASIKVDVSKLARALTITVGGIVGAMTGGPAGAGAGAGVGLTLLENTLGATTWDWSLGLKDRNFSSDQDYRVREVLSATNALIQELYDATSRPLLLLVDGIDRLDDAAAFKRLMVDSNILTDLDCSLLVSIRLEHGQRFEGRVRGVNQVLELINVGVADERDPRRLGKEVPFFHDLVARRMKWVADRLQEQGGDMSPLPSPVIDRLAWCSGGRLRDFMRFVRELAVHAWPDTIAVDDTLVETVIDEARRQRESGITAEEVLLLQRLADGPIREFPGGDMALDLMDRHRLVALPNESTWYLPHPLLTLHKVKLPEPEGQPN